MSWGRLEGLKGPVCAHCWAEQDRVWGGKVYILSQHLEMCIPAWLRKWFFRFLPFRSWANILISLRPLGLAFLSLRMTLALCRTHYLRASLPSPWQTFIYLNSQPLDRRGACHITGRCLPFGAGLGSITCRVHSRPHRWTRTRTPHSSLLTSLHSYFFFLRQSLAM